MGFLTFLWVWELKFVSFQLVISGPLQVVLAWDNKMDIETLGLVFDAYVKF